ncbi:MAG: AAA family ATPase [Gemmatimonadaceae bacterium]
MAATSPPPATQHPALYCLKLLGTPQLYGPGGALLPGLGPGKPLALVAYLAVRGEVRRDELVELLWGGIDESRARNAFRQALHRLRRGLGDDAIGGSRETVRLELGSALSCDRADFLSAIARGDLVQAARDYTGDFLEGFELGERSFDEWADAERTRLRERMQWALRQLAAGSLEEGRASDAIGFVERLCEMLPYDEDAALLHASALVAAGRSWDAIAALERLQRRLADDLGVQASRGIAETLARLQRSPRSTPPASAAASGPTARPPFVGREAEVAALLACARDLQNERGSTVVVQGGSGSGKTRLLEEFLGRAQSLGRLIVLRGRERPGSAGVPYAGIAEALRGIVRAPGIGGASQHLLAEAARLLPELRDSMDLPIPAPIEDDASRLRFFEGIAALLDAVAYEVPLALVLDDAHHAPATTLELLAYLSGRLHNSPVLLLAATRTGHPGSERLLHAIDGGRELLIGGLSPEDCVALARSVASGTGIPEEAIIAASAGNPQRVLELTRAALRGEPVRPTPVPLHHLLHARVTSCSPSQRRVFFAVALIGRPAPLRAIAAAAHLSESATLDAMGLLEQFGLVEQQPQGYALAHEESASLVHELAGPAGRAVLAGWAVDALAQEPDSPPAELAALYAAAGRHAEAFTAARAAALDAARLGARVEASRCLALAMAVAPDEASRANAESLLRALGDPPIPPPLSLQPGGPDAAAAPAEPPERAADSADAPGDLGRRSPSAPATRPRWARRTLHVALAGGALVAMALVGRWLREGSTRKQPFVTGPDSIIVLERGRERLPTASMAVEGEIVGEVDRLPGPRWVDSLALPWINALPSPDGAFVAVERMGERGTDLYVIPADRRDTIALAAGDGDDIPLGWSPDGARLLVSRGRAMSPRVFTSDLWAYTVRGQAAPVAIDTSSTGSVTEAAWSPDGAHVAWVARVGSDRQQEVFRARASGEHPVNVSRSPAEDYHIAWSPDGALLAFTSERTGNPELFASELAADRLWQLTRDPASDDRALFSPDGRSVAFESTRGRVRSVYVMPALGGSARRLTPGEVSYSLVRWVGRAAPFVDRVRVLGVRPMQRGDSIPLGVLLVDQRGAPMLNGPIQWQLIDTGAARLVPSPADNGRSAYLHALRQGTVRLVAGIPGWRADTVEIEVGRTGPGPFADSFRAPPDPGRWELLGSPRPTVGIIHGTPALVPRADLSWESGALSVVRFPVRGGLSLAVRLLTPATPVTGGAGTLTVALVADADRPIVRAAPTVQPLASITWVAESQRLVYAVDRESWSESVSATTGTPGERDVRIEIDSAGRAAFVVGGVRRWQSSLPVLGAGSTARARLWLGGRATFEQAGFAGVRLALDGR